LNFKEKLDQLESTGSLRQFRPLSDRSLAQVKYKGQVLLNMTSNDYLGIAGNTSLHQKFYDDLSDKNILENFGLGAASSRLLTGDNAGSHLLESFIREQYQRPACLLFNSGYHANIGILPALTGKNDLILSDKLNHASIHDSLRLSRADYKRFRHTDYDHLEELLSKHRQSYDNVFIITESVFSMDGDEADLPKLVELKNRFNCLLYVDEAHAVGVFGKKGLGKVEELDVINEVDLIVGTFGKAFASIGAYVVCNSDIAAFLVNFSRSLIFTTALPPVVTHWNHFVFRHIVEMFDERKKLLEMSDKLRSALIASDLQTCGNTNIVPVIIGDNQKTVDMAEKMREHGFLIFAIRPPTVPEGTARFRLSVTAAMQWDDIAPLPSIIKNSLAAR
jgi:8-amino-7-oxononanoate synthase